MKPLVKAALVPAILATSIVAADILDIRAARAQAQGIPAVTEAFTPGLQGRSATTAALEASTTLEHHRGHHGHHRRRRRRRILRHIFH